MKDILKSEKLHGVCYEIRGPVMEQAYRMEEEGHRILKLNIGNPTPFGFDAPDEIIQDVIHNLPQAQGYVESKGLFAARKAIMQECQTLGIEGIEIDDIYLGNGVSELITMATQALLNTGDELLLPMPNYPLWMAATNLTGAQPVLYRCDEGAGWMPDIDDIKAKITPRTRGIVVINPNNPTGAVYPRAVLEEIVELARTHDLVIFSDEIYSKILYDDAEFTPMAKLAEDLLCLSFNGLSKAYRLAGFRSGWMIVSGAKHRAKGFIEGMDILSSMRLCGNVPAMFAVQTALGGYQSIRDLVLPGGRLRQQRDLAHKMLNDIPGVSCVKPEGAIYLFPRICLDRHKIHNDEQLVLDFLRQEKILLVQGSAFHWDAPDHLRIVFLPRTDDLSHAIERLGHFLERYSQ
ncbi:pyridoxal phosphate-dependent aminotransferase [Microbulbifer thermotolerans]|uniref:alanine transaminase n=1 Tax=Microbulbifer thermotolerans TaxID=252514 RepID=A0A143HM81_MICTH|nr:pyridoxal phosphate-dependent aminotransferase [Microbulbifer thermotolerans]AMX02793.1 aminotransferase [Microbulbifer thermotolerans]MCX2779656.1 pyridoxal phosphate-dependent aminotransferase [Microbulbifer thermotolerans]MCX2794634.1 pyridoxal phosphate-dependent aminotransferase [Microbulbifer thermotolerans]MCX2801462.1 pyridoxal phosphate-dependent aminotransferase [Microbulbifer thermotolerans]MCX2804913.1 pyridoxal phosphate-dependent aminotransferase [Microbulbifer thermotolerans]